MTVLWLAVACWRPLANIGGTLVTFVRTWLEEGGRFNAS